MADLTFGMLIKQGPSFEFFSKEVNRKFDALQLDLLRTMGMT